MSHALLVLAAGGAAFLEAAGPLSLLAPGEVAILAAGAAIGLDPLAVGASVVSVAVGALLGSAALYLLTRLAAGCRWPRVTRALERVVPAEGRLAKMTRRRTAWLLVGGRFVAVGRAAIPILAAQARVPFARFAAWTAVGTALWGAWLLGLAVAFGRGAEALFPRGLGAGLGLAVLAVVLVAFAVRALRRRGRRAPDRPRRRELCA